LVEVVEAAVVSEVVIDEPEFNTFIVKVIASEVCISTIVDSSVSNDGDFSSTDDVS